MRLVLPSRHTMVADGKSIKVNDTLSGTGYGKIIPVRRLWRLIVNKWWILMIGMVVGGTSGFIWSKLQNSEIKRAIKVMVIPDRNETPPPTDLLGSLGGIQKFSYDNDIAILKSATLMREVVEELDLQGFLYDKNHWPFTLIYEHDKLLTAKVTGDMFIKNFRVKFNSGLQKGEVEIEGESEETTQHYSVELSGCICDTIVVGGGSIILGLTVDGERFKEGRFEYEHLTVTERSSQLLEGLSIMKAQDKSTILTLEYTSQSCLLSDRVLMLLYELYNNYHQSQRVRRLFEKENFFLSRIEKIEEELQQIDQILSSLLISNPYASAYMELGSNLINEGLHVKSVIIEGDEISSRIEQALMTVYDLSSDEPLPYSITELRPIMSDVVNEHNYLVERRAQIIEESSALSPPVLDLDEAIKRRRDIVINYLENLLSELPLSLSASTRYNEEIDSMIRRLPADVADVTHVRRQQLIKENIYQQLLRQKEETVLLMNDISDRMELLESPYTTSVPKEKGNLPLCFGVVLGLMCGVMVIGSKAMLNRKINHRYQVESIGIPILGEVSESSVSYIPLLRRHKSSLLYKDSIDKKTVEEFRLIRSNLIQKCKISNYRATIMITSVDKGCGKTFVTLNLAQAFVRLGKRVLIIDVNFRSPDLSKAIFSPSYGIVQLLVQSEISVMDISLGCKIINDRLAIIPIGNFNEAALDRLGDERWENIIGTYRDVYDIVLLDTIAADVYADVQMISRCTDCNVIVVKIGQTEQDKVRDVTAKWTEEEFRKSCIIVNYSEESRF